jgi:hypothetical protein
VRNFSSIYITIWHHDQRRQILVDIRSFRTFDKVTITSDDEIRGAELHANGFNMQLNAIDFEVMNLLLGGFADSNYNKGEISMNRRFPITLLG